MRALDNSTGMPLPFQQDGSRPTSEIDIKSGVR